MAEGRLRNLSVKMMLTVQEEVEDARPCDKGTADYCANCTNVRTVRTERGLSISGRASRSTMLWTT